MKKPRLTAVLSLLAAVACGPAESLPPSNDAGTSNDASTGCDGVCVPGVPASWFGPSLVWTGPEADAPLCDDVPGASLLYYTGYADPDGPPCGACKCDPSIGACALPAKLTANAASCAGDDASVTHTSFDLPSSWEGGCLGASEIPAGKLCGGVPCVQSVTIAPLKPGGCLPIEPPQGPPLVWKTFARACAPSSGPTGCAMQAGVCLPSPPGPEFKQCLLTKSAPNKVNCPNGYPDKSVFYENSIPYCSPCACGTPSGSSCTGSISLFQDAVCGAPPLSTVSIDAKGPTCIDVPPGSALGSETASKPSHSGGPCEPSGGVPQQTVICCRPQ